MSGGNAGVCRVYVNLSVVERIRRGKIHYGDVFEKIRKK